MAEAPRPTLMGLPTLQSWTRLVWVGDVDLYTGRLLASTLRSVWEQETVMLEVDLSGVTFMDCAGLDPLVQAHGRLPGRMRLFAPSRAVTRLLDLLGLGSLFSVVAPLVPVARPAARPPEGVVVSTADTAGTVSTAATEELAAQASHLPLALSDRASIEQAKGLLMAANGCDASAAWELLLAAARAHDVRIRVMARMLVENASSGSGPAWRALMEDVLAELARSGPETGPVRQG